MEVRSIDQGWRGTWYEKLPSFRAHFRGFLANLHGIVDAPQPHMTTEDRSAGAEIRERSFRFGCDVVNFCEKLYRLGGIARDMAPQLLNAGTALYPMLE